MRIVCPSCQATYEVPDTVLAAKPRQVRCARCGTQWAPQPAGMADEPAPGAPHADTPPHQASPGDRSLLHGTPAGEPMPKRMEPRLSAYKPRGRRADDADESLPPRDYESFGSRRGAVLGWIVSVALLLAMASAAVAWRGSVMAAWPPSERVYGALGLR